MLSDAENAQSILRFVTSSKGNNSHKRDPNHGPKISPGHVFVQKVFGFFFLFLSFFGGGGKGRVMGLLKNVWVYIWTRNTACKRSICKTF